MPNAATLLILVPLFPLLGALVCLAAGSRRALACYMAETFILLALAAGTLLVWNQANLAETSGLSFRNIIGAVGRSWPEGSVEFGNRRSECMVGVFDVGRWGSGYRHKQVLGG